MKKYKFKELKTYSSDEWMAGSTKKYRKVFDRMETGYVRAEFSFYNKLFDEEAWTANILLKAFEVTDNQRRELCSLDTKRDIRTDENIVYIRDGWGNPTAGAFWKKGEYLWEAYIDNELVGSQKFYINDIGKVEAKKNPYFTVDYIKLYEGDGEGWKQEKRKYIKTLNRGTTRYLWLEFRLKNITNLDWNYELFFNFFDDAGQLKGQVTREGAIVKGKKDFTYTFDAGWGNDAPGSWKDDKYSLEIVFMDTLIATVQFEAAEKEEEGIPELILGSDNLVKAGESTAGSGDGDASASSDENLTLEQHLEKLEGLIGLEEVKRSIKDHISYLNFLKFRKEKGFAEEEKISLHSVFTGNPGTGKTTVVCMLGQIYKKMGLLSKGHVHEVDRAELVGEYIGQTAPKVKKAIDTARGGVLFIDEAYALARQGEDSKDFGKEVIEILLKELSDGAGDIAIMVAGYPKEMEIFMNSNPGMKSRFKHYFHFDDYLPDELKKIALTASAKRGVKFSYPAEAYLEEQLIDAYRNRDRTFGNARFALGVLDEAKMNMGLRLVKMGSLETLDNEALSTIEREDVERVFMGRGKKILNITINEKMLREALDELNALTGMSNIKAEVGELVKLTRFYQETGKSVMNKFSLHAVFTGNPGTGKTTLARIIAKIYKALGLIEKGHIVEVDRQGLVAGYIGQTAVKTQERIEEAKGGVLFIDEAYALAEGGGGNDYGKEAVEVILKRMEDLRGEFAVIVAGYPDNMHTFLESNPGLRSRFDRHYVFHDYSPEELYVIAQSMLAKEGLVAAPEAEAHLKNYLQQVYDKRDKFFGNARTVRQVIGEAVKNQHLRLASLPPAERTIEVLRALTAEDVAEFVLQEEKSRPTLGFRYGSGT
ncbi:MAG: ATPase AAA [Bacteroidetes bacterium]|nr:MAG: ATPase AAA [Bacteroidota bacterium]